MSNIFTQKNDKNFQQILPLHKTQLGLSYRIVCCQLLPDILIRFAEMGLTKGTIVTVAKLAPLGDPMEINVRGYSLCPRQAEAQHIFVTQVQND